MHEYNTETSIKLSPLRKQGSRIVRELVDSRLRGNDNVKNNKDLKMKRKVITLIILMMIPAAQGKVDLVTLPSRDTVQLTIYNSADMTLVRESRALTLRDGGNKLQFSWANTLIDPTSLEMLPKANADKIDIAELVYPPRVKNLGLWNVDSGVSGKVPVEITYLTSGLSWRAFYMGTLTENEKTMHLQGYVRVTNNSGEDYENAQTRLIVGKVHILDQIAELARREYPYGRPGVSMPGDRFGRASGMGGRGGKMKMEAVAFGMDARSEPKKIVKEGLSEYFLYTIEGTETIPTGWSKRLMSFDVEDVPVVNLYKYEQERYGNSVVRFLSFKNDEEHELGETPIPPAGCSKSTETPMTPGICRIRDNPRSSISRSMRTSSLTSVPWRTLSSSPS